MTGPVLDLDAPLRVLRRNMQQVIDSVSACLLALEDAPVRESALPADVRGAVFVAPPHRELVRDVPMTPQFATPDPARGTTAKAWVIRGAVGDAMRGLEQALLMSLGCAAYLALVRKRGSATATVIEHQEAAKEAADRVEKIRKRGGAAVLLDAILDELAPHPVPADLRLRREELGTLVSARNCLEHRGGIVDQRACGPASELLVRWRGIRNTFVDEAGVERDVIRDVYIGEARFQRYAPFSRSFVLGRPIVFSAGDLFGICGALADLGEELLKHIVEAVETMQIPRANSA